MKFIVCFLASMALSACTTSPSTTAKEDDPSKGIVCRYEVPVGSSLKEKVCTTPAQREAARRQADQLVIQPGGK